MSRPVDERLDETELLKRLQDLDERLTVVETELGIVQRSQLALVKNEESDEESEMSELDRQAVKQIAYELDPECWISYSGKPRAFKRAIEPRRTAARKQAREIYLSRNSR